MRNTILSLAALAVIIYLVLCAALYFWQRSLLYFPHPPSGEPRMELAVEGAKLRVLARPVPGAKALLYFGGNGEDVSHNLPGLTAAFPDHALYLMHYRGYGGSTGAPTEAALFADAQALFDKVRADHQEVVVVGRSLGSGVATWLASRRPVSRLVLVTPYRSIEELAAGQFPWVPVRWLLQDKYESWRYAPQVSVPTLLIAAEHDDIVPRRSTDALLPLFRPGLATLRALPGTDHNNIHAHPAYYPLLRGSP
jgi:pimeloyl-ACP methyl ester carboxylesterase